MGSDIFKIRGSPLIVKKFNLEQNKKMMKNVFEEDNISIIRFINIILYKFTLEYSGRAMNFIPNIIVVFAILLS